MPESISYLVTETTSVKVFASSEAEGLLSILGFAFTMVTGGNDTTTGMLGGAVLRKRSSDSLTLPLETMAPLTLRSVSALLSRGPRHDGYG